MSAGISPTKKKNIASVHFFSRFQNLVQYMDRQITYLSNIQQKVEEKSSTFHLTAIQNYTQQKDYGTIKKKKDKKIDIPPHHRLRQKPLHAQMVTWSPHQCLDMDLFLVNHVKLVNSFISQIGLNSL